MQKPSDISRIAFKSISLIAKSSFNVPPKINHNNLLLFCGPRKLYALFRAHAGENGYHNNLNTVWLLYINTSFTYYPVIRSALSAVPVHREAGFSLETQK